MLRVITLLGIGILIYCQGNCQRGVYSLGFGPTVGFPVSNKNFSYYYKNGFGGTLQANFGVTKLGSVTANIMHLSIGAKEPPVSKTSLTLVKAGYRTNFLDSRFFVSADAGLQFSSRFNYFVMGVTVGYSFKVSKTSYIDLFPSYNQIFGTPNNSMWLTANILYRFNLKKRDKQ